MTASNRWSVLLFVCRNQIFVDLVLIHKVKAFIFFYIIIFRWFLPHTRYIGKDLLEIHFFFLFDRTLEVIITILQ